MANASGKLAKPAAAAVLVITMPILVDIASEPYADRGPVRSWLTGVGKIAVALVLFWSADQFRPDDVSRETEQG